MNSNTPKFDQAIQQYFAGLELDKKGGQWRTCRFSGEKFYVRPEDVKFYRKISVPLPTLSPLERWRRKLAFAPGYQFFKVRSAHTGKEVISVYPANTPFKICEHEIWFSDQWEPLSYGKVPDAEQPFFDQFRELQREVPRPNLNNDSSNVNSEYTNSSMHLKNCYVTFDSVYGEDLYYFECCTNNKNCMDCWACLSADSCYGSHGTKIFKCSFCYWTENSIKSYFLFDCKSCEYCFMCSNLRNKKYCFSNQQLSKEEYEKKIREINLGNYEELQKYLRDFQELRRNAIKKNIYGEKWVNSVGSWMVNVKDCYFVLFAYESEGVCYSLGFLGARDSYDVLGGTNMELCYEFLAISAENNYGIKFSHTTNNSRDLEYCDSCFSCHDCFGCVGLRNKSFCVFNKQYSPEEYWRVVDLLKTHMLGRGEYGEFFPPALAPFPYNASLTTAYPGFEDLEKAKQDGYWIESAPDDASVETSLPMLRASELPLDIKDVDDSILQKVILDEEHNKKFRIVPFELAFYRKYNLPLPRVHPFIRMAQWRKDMDLRPQFWEVPCAKCGKVVPTMYDPARGEKNIYCEPCYNAKVA